MPQDPSLSVPLLQGGKVSSRTSLELSSLRVVWQPGKCKGKEEQAGELKASRQKEILLMKEIPLLQCLSAGSYSQPFIPNIKKKQKEKLLQGTKREENQKVTKESQNVKGRMNSGTRKAISHHGAKFSHCGAKFSASLLSLLLLLLSF